MTTSKLNKVTANINNDKTIMKFVNNNSFYSVETFIQQAERYIKAIEQGRMINSIGSVSKSGMSRTIKFIECNKSKNSNHHNFLNFFSFFKALGYSEARSQNGYFTVSGCGMDMIFHTNYTNIHVLCRLGFITKKKCEKLAQMTPYTI